MAIVKTGNGYRQAVGAADSQEVAADQLPAYTPIATPFGRSTALPDLDFETYSEAGHVWLEGSQKWASVAGKGKKKGLPVVGAAVYAEHESTEILQLSYNLKDGKGPRLWLPGNPPPLDLFEHIAKGHLLEAHNSLFEWLIWFHVGHKRMGWPRLPLSQLRCSMSKARAFSAPGGLGPAGKFLGLPVQKDGEGKRLIRLFSVPRNPTKKDPRTRLDPYHHAEGPAFYSYGLHDIKSESELSAHLPDLNPAQLRTWLTDQRINARGVGVDITGVYAFINHYENYADELNAELRQLTGGAVLSASKSADFLRWCSAKCVYLDDTQGETIEAYLKANANLPDDLARALTIKLRLSYSAVKKLYAFRDRTSYDNRARDLFNFAGADRTGRFSGAGAQPQNFPNSGPDVLHCDPLNGCGGFYGTHLDGCPHCSAPGWAAEKVGWSAEAALWVTEYAPTVAPAQFRYAFDNVAATIAGCLRALFVAGPGKELICSDYSAIEAVVLAWLAGEQWRLDVFNTHGKIYEMTVASITGISFAEVMAHAGYDVNAPNWWEAKQTGEHHPLRKTVGKVAELASGYQGGHGAWCKFGAEKFLSDLEIADGVKKWRQANPLIVKFWYQMEEKAIDAVRFPGSVQNYRSIAFCFEPNTGILRCRLPSGRCLHYHGARADKVFKFGRERFELSYLGIDGKTGKITRDSTYGGKLTENITQAVSADILCHALCELDENGYPIVLHVHDEPIAEVDAGTKSVEEFEAIMQRLPAWAEGCPVSAAGGWRGKRYRKD